MGPETKPLLEDDGLIPPGIHIFNNHLNGPQTTPFTSALSSSPPSKPRLPQAIAHRGFKTLYPENTILAFRAALEAGAHALETDLHLSRDGVVVLSHDGNLKRCFGVDAKIAECDWDYLKTLQTVREPRQGMPRLEDLLEFLCEEGRSSVWVLLDIKQPYINHCRSLLPTYPIAIISWSPLYARKFLSQPNVSFNMFQKSLVGPVGKLFIRNVRKQDRRLFVWTVNDEEWMEWSIRAEADGVITDDPELFLDVCRRWDGKRFVASSSAEGGRLVLGSEEETAVREAARKGRVRDGSWRRTLKLWVDVVGVQVLVAVFTPVLMFAARFGLVGPGPKAQKALRL
ncbi:Phosphatidylglycerol phospholipase C [Colletotrichum chlorophyti]|uniref:Phosphatidylglycerol phospholipase C n=1 Tax=Colletotrichum chlorophyti TaxID=708187 RepID=A0A1Q8RMT2_9PEZI|nr:Phosphatidylglycerol phospholipase C [Colletotrichum chlorophyti]